MGIPIGVARLLSADESRRSEPALAETEASSRL